MAYYLNCIDNINTNIINDLSSVSKNKCDKEKNEEECKKNNYYDSFLQISNIINYKKNDWLEIENINEFRNILNNDEKLFKELKDKLKLYNNSKIDRYIIFKFILEYYLSNVYNKEHSNNIKKCIKDVEFLKNKKETSDMIFNNIKNRIEYDNNGILPMIDNTSFNILSELINILVFDCYVKDSYCNYQKKDIYNNITLKIKNMKCDDFKHINKAIRNISNELKNNKYNKLSQFYSGMRSYMNEYIYSILPNKYITDEECLPSNFEEYTDDKVKYIKNPFNKKKLKYND